MYAVLFALLATVAIVLVLVIVIRLGGAKMHKDLSSVGVGELRALVVVDLESLAEQLEAYNASGGGAPTSVAWQLIESHVVTVSAELAQRADVTEDEKSKQQMGEVVELLQDVIATVHHAGGVHIDLDLVPHQLRQYAGNAISWK